MFEPEHRRPVARAAFVDSPLATANGCRDLAVTFPSVRIDHHVGAQQRAREQCLIEGDVPSAQRQAFGTRQARIPPTANALSLPPTAKTQCGSAIRRTTDQRQHGGFWDRRRWRRRRWLSELVFPEL